MKKKYVAVMLGLVLSMSTASVYAAGSSAETAAESTKDSSSDDSDSKASDDESNAGEGGDGYCNLYIGEGCTWTVTGDSTLTSLSSSGTITDEDGNTVTVKGTDGTVYVEGESSYTVTVASYSDTADLSGASSTTQWSDYETEKPEALA